MFPPDVAALIADHGLAVELKTVLGVQGVQVGLDQPSEAGVQVDPGAVPADSHVANPHLRPGEVAGGDDRNRHQHLVKIALQTAGNLQERTAFLVSSDIRDNLATTLRKTIIKLPACQTDRQFQEKNFRFSVFFIDIDLGLHGVSFVKFSRRSRPGCSSSVAAHLGLVNLLVLQLEPGHLLPEPCHGVPQSVELVGRGQSLQARLGQLGVLLE